MYHDLRLQYDLVQDELITNNYQHSALIRLPKEKVDSFSIEGPSFSSGWFVAKTNGALLDNGYYEQLTSNEMPVFAKRIKKFVIPNGYEDPEYVQYNTFYLKLNNSFYPVGGKKFPA